MIDWSYWNPFRPGARSKAEVVRILESAINGTLDCQEWDNFINIPMKGDPQMEAVRLACEALQAAESIGADGAIAHTLEARSQLQRLLAGLKQ